MSLKETSKYISLILRHKPEVIGITLDEHGWANVDELIEGVNRTHPLTRELLDEIVRTDEKQRYSFNEDKTLIRANQGHSVPVDVELPETEPPTFLFHGTGGKFVSQIDRMGLIPKSRLYVHLSGDPETAAKVGSRHGKPFVYRVLAKQMYDEGLPFYLSVNGVWLTKSVPVKYLRKEIVKIEGAEMIEEELIKAFHSDDFENEIEEKVLPKFGWDRVQDALIAMLADDRYTRSDYEKIADVFWGAVLDEKEIKKEAVVGLLYYRLGKKEAPYENNVIWSIASKVYGLDYGNSECNPLQDQKILAELKKYGL